MLTKKFHIGDILSITDGHLVSLDHIGGVYNILNWMTDDELFTHQLIRAANECAPTLKELFPDLCELEVPPIDSMGDLVNWYSRLESEGFEMYREVPRIEERDHEHINPILELQSIMGADRVISVHVDSTQTQQV